MTIPQVKRVGDNEYNHKIIAPSRWKETSILLFLYISNDGNFYSVQSLQSRCPISKLSKFWSPICIPRTWCYKLTERPTYWLSTTTTTTPTTPTTTQNEQKHQQQHRMNNINNQGCTGRKIFTGQSYMQGRQYIMKGGILLNKRMRLLRDLFRQRENCLQWTKRITQWSKLTKYIWRKSLNNSKSTWSF